MNSKILIIDDEKDICFLLSEILQDEKFVTELAFNSNEFSDMMTKIVCQYDESASIMI